MGAVGDTENAVKGETRNTHQKSELGTRYSTCIIFGAKTSKLNLPGRAVDASNALVASHAGEAQSCSSPTDV